MTVDVGCNMHAPVIEVLHSELKRLTNLSAYRSECPVCDDGVLGVYRNTETLKLEEFDRCMLCGQAFRYLVICTAVPGPTVPAPVPLVPWITMKRKNPTIYKWLGLLSNWTDPDTCFQIRPKYDGAPKGGWDVKFCTEVYEYTLVMVPPKRLRKLSKKELSLRLAGTTVPAKTRSRSKGYLGATVSSRKTLAGENWRRGSDLPDGAFEEKTWTEIKNKIITHEMVRLVQPEDGMNFKAIVSSILNQQENLPTLLGLNKDLDTLIEEQFRK